jgi:hypothetical protein
MRSWRDVLPVHPAADLFPPMSPDELKALAEDIKKKGQLSPVAIQGRGRNRALVDGRNRLDAMELAGIKLVGRKRNSCDGSFRVIELHKSVDPYEYVLSANVHRRHLTAEQKRDIIAKVLKAQPEKSDLAISKIIKSSDKTVTKVRAELEGRSEIPNVKTKTDTRGRKQPTKKQRRKKAMPAKQPVTVDPEVVTVTPPVTVTPVAVEPAFDDEPFIDNPDDRELEKRRRQFLKDAAAALACGQVYDGPIDTHIIKVARAVRNTWAKLVRELRNGEAQRGGVDLAS